eukprot:scaffold7033_cov257-Pinguiococcus_pyrenoidosus.AAC.7
MHDDEIPEQRDPRLEMSLARRGRAKCRPLGAVQTLAGSNGEAKLPEPNFAAGRAMSVLLGVPKRGTLKTAPSAPTASYVGGRPVFLRPPRWQEAPRCGGSFRVRLSSRLVYSQSSCLVEWRRHPSRERKLCTGALTLHPSSRHVLRQNATSAPPEQPQRAPSPPPAPDVAAPSAWGGPEWGGGASWGQASASDDQIEQLFSELERSSAAKAAKKPAPQHKAKQTQQEFTQEVFPCTEMEILVRFLPPEEPAPAPANSHLSNASLVFHRRSPKTQERETKMRTGRS